jgi:hypothetical protein
MKKHDKKLNLNDIRETRVVDVPDNVPVIRFGMARFCPTCDVIHDKKRCPKCDGGASLDLMEVLKSKPGLRSCLPHKFELQGAWWTCARCGEMEAVKEEVVFSDHPRLIDAELTEDEKEFAKIWRKKEMEFEHMTYSVKEEKEESP